MLRDGVVREFSAESSADLYAQVVTAEIALIIIDAIDETANTDVGRVIGIGEPRTRRKEVLAGLSKMTFGIILAEHSSTATPDDVANL